jgi:hypothetical protein
VIKLTNAKIDLRFILCSPESDNWTVADAKTTKGGTTVGLKLAKKSPPHLMVYPGRIILLLVLFGTDRALENATTKHHSTPLAA